MNIEKIKAKLREKSNEDVKNQKLLARSEATPIEILEELCEVEDIYINIELLKNKKVQGNLREKAQNTRKRIEKNILEKAKENHEEFYTKEYYELEALIEDENTSSETLTIIYENYLEEIIDYEYNLSVIYYDEEEERNLCRAYTRLGILEEFIKNPNTPKEIVQKVIERMKHEPIEEVYESYYSIYGVRTADDIVERIARRQKTEENNEKKEIEKLLKYWYDEDYELRKEEGYLDFETASYYRELAEHPNTPKEILEKLIDIDFSDLSEELLSNESLTYEMILRVAEINGYKMDNEDVEYALARCKEIPEDVIAKLEDSEHPKVLLALLARTGRERKFAEEATLGALKAGIGEEDVGDVGKGDISTDKGKNEGEEIDE